MDFTANDNLKLLVDDGSDAENESTDDESNARKSAPKSRFTDGKLIHIFLAITEYFFFGQDLDNKRVIKMIWTKQLTT